MQIENLTKTYLSKKGKRSSALQDISLKINNKGFLLLSGKSGAGKSTLINILSGLDTDYEGDVFYRDIHLKNLSRKELNAYRNSEIGFIFQDFCLIENKTVFENLSLPLEIQNSKENQIEKLLHQFGLEEHKDKYPSELSGGEQQRVAIARALLKNPNILIADEPTSSLDLDNATMILDLLKEISETKLVIVVSHDISLIKPYADRIILLENGKIRSDSQPQLYDAECEPFCFKKTSVSLKFIIKESFHHLYDHLKFYIFILFAIILSLAFVGSFLTMNQYHPNEILLHSAKSFNDTFLTLKPEESNKNSDLELDSALQNQVLDMESCIRFQTGIDTNFANRTYSGFSLCLAEDNLSGIIVLSSQNQKKINHFLIEGTFPTKENEVVITDYLFQSYKAFGYRNQNTNYSIHTFEDLTSVPFDIDSHEYRIVGVIDTKFNYDYYKNKIENKTNNHISDEIHSLNQGIHTALFVHENFFKQMPVSSLSCSIQSADKEFSYRDLEVQISKNLQGNEIICPTSFIGESKIKIDNLGEKNVKIISSCSENRIYLSEEFYETIRTESTAPKTTGFLLKLSEKEQINRKNLEFFQKNHFVVESPYEIMMESIKDTYDLLKNIILYLSIVLFLLGVLLCLKFSWDSIESDKKQIAIDKVLGMTYSDISKIYLIQAVFSAILTFSGAVPLAVVMNFSLNTLLNSLFGVQLVLPIISIPTILFLFGVPLFLFIVSLIYPLYRYNQKQNPLQLLKSL